MHKQVFLSRDATTLDFPVAPLVGDKPSQVESIIAVETTFGRAVVANRYHEQLLDWIGRAADEPTQWQRAASFSDYLLYVTADELEELVGQVTGLIERYADRVADRSARPANSRLVTYLNLAMPARDDGTDRPTP